ncbi:hypothetical protein A2U01_0112796, partial [Trifolium medium]|nr:hypothetical protein [Trifolium medium]
MLAQRAYQRARWPSVAFSCSSQEFSDSCWFLSLSFTGARNFQIFCRFLSLDLAQRARQDM